MKVLIVARCKNGHYAPFITEQVEALKKQGVKCLYFGVNRKGFFGYLWQLPELMKVIRRYSPDLIHAHYGLCGILANWQRKIPVITTYHGSDINNPKVLKLSRIAIRKSRFNIFVSQKNIDIVQPKGDNYALIPCGINLEDYPIIEKYEARQQMGLNPSKKYVLFAGAYDNPVKNASLAKAAMDLVPEAEMIELKGYSRKQVATLMQAVDVLLMTSHTEGSPQVIKEVMACGCPIVSVDVGDVREGVSDIDGCYITERNDQAIADMLNISFTFTGRTRGRDEIVKKQLTNDQIAIKIASLYERLV